MKNYILLLILIFSFKTYSSDNSSCENYNKISESLSKECNPKVIKGLIKLGNKTFEEKINCKPANDIERPGMILVDLAAKKFCSDALVIISAKVTAKDFADGAKINFAEEYLKEAIKTTEKNRGASENAKEDVIKINQMNLTMKIIANRSMVDCKKSIKESCEALEELKKLVGKISAATEEDCKKGNKESCPETKGEEQTDEEYLKSPEYIIDQACPMKFELERYETILKNEKEVGKVSGAVNAKTLRNTGAMIVMIKPKLEQWKKAYLNKTKHNIDLKKCNRADYFSE
jgi:hypothetical protein